MTAYTKPFKIDSNEQITMNFGVIERPREALIIDKTITNFKITLANGQILTEGNPEEGNIKYTKCIGFDTVRNSMAQAAKNNNKRLLIEIDTSLIQSSKLEATYEINVINKNEIDYNYENSEYQNEFEGESVLGDKFITRKDTANYYYYGRNTDNNGNAISELQAQIEIVDYLDKDVNIDNIDKKSIQWNENQSVTELLDEGKISINAKNASEGKYHILKSNEITVDRNQTKPVLGVKISKLLSNTDNNAFDNNVEIIVIDGKTARNVPDKYKDEQNIEREEETIPGNFVVEKGNNIVGSVEPIQGILGRYEADDDKVEIIITPPTGLTNNIIIYITTILAGLILVYVGIIVIKEKVLIK